MISFKDFFSFKNNRQFWMNIIGMVVAIIMMFLLVLFGLNLYTRHGEAVVVPDVKGMLLNEAELNISKKELKTIVIDSNFVKGVPVNTILEQNPVAGQKVKKGRMIYLTICTDNEPLVTIPDIVDNSSYRQAEARLKALGFLVSKPKIVAGERDWVYALKIGERTLYAGEKIPRESLLTLEIGSGSDSVQGDSLNQDSILPVKEREAETADDTWF